MRNVSRLLFLFALTLQPCVSRAEKAVAKGFVTHFKSASAFDVDGTHVSLSATTSVLVQTHSPQGEKTTRLMTPLHLSIGQIVEVTGNLDRSGNQISATKVLIAEAASAEVSGVAIVDALPADASATSTDPDARIIRADGYTMLLTGKTVLTFDPPLNATSPLSTNLWIKYRGTQRVDGMVIVEEASFSVNTVKHDEDNLREKVEYDPAAINPDDAQGGLSKHLVGLKVKRLPPYKDETMQARISQVGSRLVPTFQRALPEKDPTRIHFRFHLVDLPKAKDCIPLDSGIILVPRQIVERLPDDSQLAAILADNIAEVLEKQDYRGKPTEHKLTAANWAGAAAGIVILGAGIATNLATYEVDKSILARQRQQSGRVSLCLMHDAGYDLDQAPRAWWTLHTKAGKDMTASSMPDRTLFLYEDLGTTWHSLYVTLNKPGD